MTLSCAARYPELWACAIDTVGMYDLVTFLDNTAEYRRAHRESEYGSLTEHYDILKAVSLAAKIAYYGAFYGLPWVEVRGWILEYNREAIPYLPYLPAICLYRINVAHHKAAVVCAGKPKQYARKGSFTAARFAYERKYLAFANGK